MRNRSYDLIGEKLYPSVATLATLTLIGLVEEENKGF